MTAIAPRPVRLIAGGGAPDEIPANRADHDRGGTAHLGAEDRLRRAQREASAETRSLGDRDHSSAPAGSTNRDTARGVDPPLT